MKIMRANYDKPFRCPAQSGPAFKGIDEMICRAGSLAVAYSRHSDDWKRLYKPHWVVLRCPECNTAVIPFVLRWLDPAWLLWKVQWHARKVLRMWQDWGY
ncbi:hypothetical protein [Arthrobacter sp. A2-55]|uniref:hypothetical protein n=1 Tax=Arthrobacter sp. A2-55 TaxID=2897337 RepID=UPI0021CDBEF7|nr:hypothetical protein [Arthrobacter sp. A2-55]MCU6481923.1 hypothetical protein [Arthrobacter sp. A2-55]